MSKISNMPRLTPAHQSLIGAIRLAFANFMRDGITGTAASGMAYYFIFSIFPITLLMAVAIGHIATPVFAQEEITSALSIFLPHDAVKLIHDNLGFVAGQEQEFGILAVLGLGWSSLGILAEITRVLDVVFNVPVPRTMLQQRLLAALMLASLVILLMFLFITLGILRLITVLMLDHMWFWVWVALRMLPVSLNMGVLALLFYRIPNCEVRSGAIWPASIVGAFGWELVRLGFNWYIGHVARYSIVYGSISVVMILMLWSYLVSLVFLLSAEICARLNDWFEANEKLARPQSKLIQTR